MPSMLRKPNLGTNLKTSFNMSIPRAGAQRPGRVGEVATNNKIVSMNSGGRAPKSGGPKRGKTRMY